MQPFQMQFPYSCATMQRLAIIVADKDVSFTQARCKWSYSLNLTRFSTDTKRRAGCLWPLSPLLLKTT